MKIENPKFITIESSYVAFLDILGFKDLVDNNKHQELIKIFDFIIDSSVNSLVEHYNLPKGGVMNLQGEQFTIDTLAISDSIILWTRNNSPRSFVKLTMLVSDILGYSILAGFPIRGALSCGPLSVYKNSTNTTVFGKGLTDAYKLEQIQNWAGCIIDDNAINEFENETNKLVESGYPKENAVTVKQLMTNPPLVIQKYKAPLKSGPQKTYFIINWSKSVYGKTLKPKEIKNSFSDFNKNIEDWKVKNIIDNTLSYYKKKRNT